MKAGDNGPIIQRSMRYIFPPLPEARRRFQQYIGAPVPWNEDVAAWQLDPDPEYPGDSDVI